VLLANAPIIDQIFNDFTEDVNEMFSKMILDHAMHKTRIKNKHKKTVSKFNLRQFFYFFKSASYSSSSASSSANNASNIFS